MQWMYLHVHGTLHFKQCYADELLDSPFVRCYWPCDNSRQSLWQVAIESLAMGVSRAEVLRVLESNKFEIDDCVNYINFLNARLSKDGNQWCVTRGDFVNLEVSPSGFGDTPMDALADLLKNVGFKGRGMWCHDINSLVKMTKPKEPTE